MVPQGVKEIQHVKHKRRRRILNLRREPTGAQKLPILRNSIRQVSASAVFNNERVGVVEFKNHKVLNRRGVRARIIRVMSKLDDKAESGERRLLEKLSVPLLEYAQKRSNGKRMGQGT